MSQQFCLKWNNHSNNMMDVFKNLLSSESMVDVTLACDGLSLKAHKIVLSACSPFFQSLFLENPCKHPIVILKDMKYSELKAIIEFMYHGEVNVAQDQLSALMKTAETLRVKGLAEVTNEKNSQSSSAPQDEPSHRSSSRMETPPPSKRRRGRVRKRSLSDSNRSDDSNEPKIKQPVSPDIEELSGDHTMDASSGQFSNLQSQVPMQSTSSLNTNSFHKSVVSQDPQIEEPASADESEFGVEPSKLLEQTLTTDDLSNARRSGRSSLPSGMEMQRRPRSSTDHASNLVPTSMPSEALGSNQQPESPPDIKPELLELDPPMSPVPGPSHSTDNSMMMYMDQSSVSSHPGSSYQDNSTALVPQDSQPQVKLSIDGIPNCSDDNWILSSENPQSLLRKDVIAQNKAVFAEKSASDNTTAPLEVPQSAHVKKEPPDPVETGKKPVPSRSAIECIDLTDETYIPNTSVSRSAFAAGLLNHPAPLPPTPFPELNSALPNVPPKPRLKIQAEDRGVVLVWDMLPSTSQNEYAKPNSYDVFGYQEQANLPVNSMAWKKIGRVEALALPMLCVMIPFQEGKKYHFAVRAVDVHGRLGCYSDPITIVYTLRS